MKVLQHIWAAAFILTSSPLAAGEDTESKRTISVGAAEDARAAGNFDLARTILRKLLVERPDDADLLRRLAMVEAYDGDLDSAIVLINQAAVLAPDDLDIALARGYILFWRGDLAASRIAVEAIEARDPNYPELATLRTAVMRDQTNAGVHLRSLTFGGGLSTIKLRNGTSRTWNTEQLVAAVDLSGQTTLAVGLMREERNVSDNRLSARMDRQFGNGAAYIGVTVVPDPDFQEHWSLAGGAQFRVARGLLAMTDARIAEYDAGTIFSFQPGLEATLANDVFLTGRAINILGGGEGYRIGGSLRLDYRREDKPNFFLIVASYPDAEGNNIEQLRSAAIGTNFPIFEQVSLTAVGSYEDRDNSYRRWSGNLALTYRFGAN